MRLCGIPFVILLFAIAFSFYVNGQHDIANILTRVVIIALSMLPLLSLVAFVMSGTGTKWFVSDAGLKRVLLFGEPEIIPWDRIYHMANTERGFFIRWRNPQEPGAAEEDLEHRAIFYPTKADADELLALWQKKTSREFQAEGQAHFKARNLRTSNQMLRAAWGMIAVGVALIGWGAVNIARQYPSTAWPSVEGKIISQQYRSFPPGGSHKHWTGQVAMSYEYVVAGQTNRSDQYSLSHASFNDDLKTAEAFAREHQRGAIVKVYYHPKHPEQAVLLPGPSWREDSALMVLGACAAAFGALMRSLFSKLKRGLRALKR